MKQTLQLKLSQHLTLTPQLQQSIRLLQLSTLELNAEVERILQENPLLERAGGSPGGLRVLDVLAGPAFEEPAEVARDPDGPGHRRRLEPGHGLDFVEQLEGLAARTSLPPLARFVDGVAVAVERGTPLAEVLRSQAQDVRELGRRRLMESGGRKEIAMMVPVVFLVLPVTVLFAVYPGLVSLDLQL